MNEAEIEVTEGQETQNAVYQVDKETTPEVKTNIGEMSDVDFEAFRTSLSEKNFIELTFTKNTIAKQIESIESTKKSLDSISGLVDSQLSQKPKAEDDLKLKIELENELAKNGYKENKDQFYAQYETFTKNLNSASAAVAEALKKFENVKKTAKFLTDEMLTILKQKENDATTEEAKKRFAFLISVYENRSDLSYLIKKASLTYILHNLKKELNHDYAKCAKRARKQFNSIFSQTQLGVSEKYLLEKFHNDQRSLDLFIYQMMKIARYDGANSEWVKVLFINLVDIAAKVYDIDGGSERIDSQLEQLYQLYFKVA